MAGNVTIESIGGPTFGFGGGRVDVFEPEKDIYWGTAEEWLGATRMDEEPGRALENPLAAIQMGLIYVNPEGPGGQSDPMPSARATLEPFDGLVLNDEDTRAPTARGEPIHPHQGRVCSSDKADN